MKEVFEYFASLARLNVKQIRSVDQWKVPSLDSPHHAYLASLPKHDLVESFLVDDNGLDPGVALSVKRPELHDPPGPPKEWSEWASANGIDFDPLESATPPPRPILDGEESPGRSAVDAAAARYGTALDNWRPGYSSDKRVLDLFVALWETRQLILTEPERYEFFLGFAVLQWAPDGSPVQRPLVTVPAEIQFDPATPRIDIEFDESEIRVETDMLSPQYEPSRSESESLRDQLGELEALFDRSALTEPMGAFVAQIPNSGGRGKWSPSPRPATSDADELTVTFAPMIGVRPRMQRARVTLLEGLAGKASLTTAMRSLVEITDAHTSALPSGAEIEDRFHPELLLPQPSSQAQRQIALSMERNPLTVVFGPPGTGKTYTIANLVGHLLAQGKRVLITAEKEEALHEVRGKIIKDVQELVVPVLRGSPRDKKRLAQSISRISEVRQTDTIAARHERAQRLHEELDGLRAARLQLLNELAQAWEGEQTLDFDASPYTGDLEAVADAVERDRHRYEWFKDRPSAYDLPLSETDLQAIRHLVDAELQSAEGLGRELPDAEALLNLAESVHLAEELTSLRANLQALVEHRDREAAISVSVGHDEAFAVADVIAEVAGWIGDLEGSALPHVHSVLAAASRGDVVGWRGRVERSSRAVEDLGEALAIAADHKVDPGGVSAAVVRGASASLVDAISPGKTLRRLFRSQQTKEAIANLDRVTVDGSVIDTHEEAVIALAWAEAQLAHERLLEDWDGHSDRFEDATLAQAADIARALVDQVATALTGVDKAESELRPVWEIGVKFADPWSASELRSDAQAVRWAAEANRLKVVLADIGARGARAEAHQLDAEELTNALGVLADHSDAAPWHRLLERFSRVRSLQQNAQRARDAVQRLSTVAPMYAAGFNTDIEQAVSHLEDLRDATRWGYTVGALEAVETREPVLERLIELDVRFRGAVGELVEAQAWLRVHEQLEEKPELARALRQFAAAQAAVPKTKTAKSYPMKLRASQRALRACWDAVPAWVMSLDQAAEMFGERTIADGPPPFDVVIVDEASQSPLTSAFVMQMADKVTIVGDPHQTEPPSFQSFDAQASALGQISDPDLRDRLMPGQSLWKAAAVAMERVSLTEHFRCPPEVIGWAQEVIYRDLADIELEILTGTERSRPKPVVAIAAMNGSAEGPQIDSIVADLESLLADAPEWVRDVGVIARDPQLASKIQRAVFDRIPALVVEEYQIRVGTPYQFQGAQRDLIYLAMSDQPPEPGKLHPTRSFDSTTVNQMNVATSRARKQLRVFYSCVPAGYRAGDVRRSFLEYALAADVAWDQRTAPGVPETVSDDIRCEPFDSLSEQRLFNELVRRGFMVEPQVPAPVNGHNYRLDFVVHGPVGRVVVEYDGPHHDTLAQYLADQERQHDLERCGWTVVRVHHSDFNRARSEAVDQLVAKLVLEEVVPVLEWDDLLRRVASDDAQTEQQAISDEDLDNQDEAESPAPQRATDPSKRTPVEDGQVSAMPLGLENDGAIDRGTSTAPPTRGHDDSSVADSSARGPGALAPYVTFDGVTPLATEVEKAIVSDWLVRIVEVEGPILGGRLLQVYNKASGRTKTSKEIRSAINSAITSALRRGRLVDDNPTNQQGNKFTTFRLPEQVEQLERELGPRSIHDVPHAELASRLASHRAAGISRDACYRAVLEEYGLSQLRAATRRTLDMAWDLAA